MTVSAEMCRAVRVLRPYRRPNNKVSESLREGALQPLRRGLYLTGRRCAARQPVSPW